MNHHVKPGIKKMIILLSALFYANVYSQGGWYIQLNSPTADIMDLHFINDKTGWAVGFNGSVIKTSNGGVNWVSYNINSDYQLSLVRFVNEKYGFAGGFKFDGDLLPHLFRTTDGGITWTISFQVFGTSGVLRSINFINESTGFFGVTYYGVGHVYKTTNSGNNWTLLNTNLSTGYSASDIHFVNTSTGYVSSYKVNNQNDPIVNIIIKSTDAGNSWFELHRDTVPYSNSNWNRKVFFFNDNTGYLQRGDLYKTTNGGLNFVSRATGFINTYCFPSIDTGWCTGYDGKIIKTTNGGNTWISQSLSSGNDLFPVFFINSQTGWTGGGGLILNTKSGGITTVTQSTQVAKDHKLFQNFPNPFNPSTNIKFTLASVSEVKLSVWTLLGSHIIDLINENLNAGSYEIEFDAGKYSLSSGVYFYTLSSEDFRQTRKFILLK